MTESHSDPAAPTPGLGAIHWTELNTTDAPKACAFYEAVMGWSFNKMPMPDGSDYYIAMRGGAPLLGIFTMAGPEFAGIPSHWLTYFQVADMAKTLADIRAAGGAVKREPFSVEGVGDIAIVADSTGAVSGLVQPPAGGAA